MYRFGASDVLYYRPLSVNCTVLVLMIYSIGASDVLYYRPPLVKYTVLGQVNYHIQQVIYCILDPHQSNVPV